MWKRKGSGELVIHDRLRFAAVIAMVLADYEQGSPSLRRPASSRAPGLKHCPGSGRRAAHDFGGPELLARETNAAKMPAVGPSGRETAHDAGTVPPANRSAEFEQFRQADLSAIDSLIQSGTRIRQVSSDEPWTSAEAARWTNEWWLIRAGARDEKRSPAEHVSALRARKERSFVPGAMTQLARDLGIEKTTISSWYRGKMKTIRRTNYEALDARCTVEQHFHLTRAVPDTSDPTNDADDLDRFAESTMALCPAELSPWKNARLAGVISKELYLAGIERIVAPLLGTDLAMDPQQWPAANSDGGAHPYLAEIQRVVALGVQRELAEAEIERVVGHRRRRSPPSRSSRRRRRR